MPVDVLMRVFDAVSDPSNRWEVLYAARDGELVEIQIRPRIGLLHRALTGFATTPWWVCRRASSGWTSTGRIPVPHHVSEDLDRIAELLHEDGVYVRRARKGVW